MIRHYRYHAATTLLLALVSGGCSLPKFPTWDDWSVTRYEDRVKETKYQQPTRMVVLWSPAIQNGPNTPKAQRGFGGRIYFYNAADQAVPVEGQLIVYGYNDTSPQQRHVKPDKKFVFSPQQFTAHYSPTELGASYSVWVDWDDVGGPQAEVSLVPIFTSSSGHIVVGQTSRNVLPGPTTPAPNTQIQTSTITPQIHDERAQPAAFSPPTSYVPISPTTHGMVEQASYQQPAAAMQPRSLPGTELMGIPPAGQLPPGMHSTGPVGPMTAQGMNEANRPQLETMSITLPSSLASRMAAAAAEQQTAGENRGMQSHVAGAPPVSGYQQPAMAYPGYVPASGSPAPATQTAPTFTAPTNSSRSWGPVTPRRGALPLGPQSRYAPPPPQAPASPGPQPFAGPPPMQPPHGAPGPVHPQWPQSGTPIAGPATGGAASGNRL
jgi:hypothetical protein